MNTPFPTTAGRDRGLRRPRHFGTKAWARYAGMLGLAGLISCGKPSSDAPSTPIGAAVLPAQEAVATVGGSSVSQETFLRAWNRRRPDSSTLADKSALLEDLVRRELLFVETERIGFKDRPDIRVAWHEFVINRFAEELASQRAAIPSPSSAEIRSHYESHPSQYSSPERVRAALILLKLSPRAEVTGRESRAAELEVVRDQALQQAASLPDFGELARHSEHRTSKRAGGDLGWMTRDAAARVWPEEVVEALFTLQQRGEISPVIRTSEGFFLLKLIERQPGQPLPLEEVQERIRQQLGRIRTQEAEEAQYADLKLRHPVCIHTNLLVTLGGSGRQVAARPPTQPAH